VCFVEKPHGIDPAGARLMKAAAELAPGEKTLPRVRLYRAVIMWATPNGAADTTDGAIGDVVRNRVRIFCVGPYGVVERKPG